jgi:transposase
LDFEYLRDWLVEGLGYRDGAKDGRPPFDPVSMLKALILQAQHNLSDARVMEFMIGDRLSWMRFLGFDRQLKKKGYIPLSAIARNR